MEGSSGGSGEGVCACVFGWVVKGEGEKRREEGGRGLTVSREFKEPDVNLACIVLIASFSAFLFQAWRVSIIIWVDEWEGTEEWW